MSKLSPGRAAAGFLLTLVLTFGLTACSGDDKPAKPKPAASTFVDGPDADRKRDDKLDLDATAKLQLDRNLTIQNRAEHLEQDMRSAGGVKNPGEIAAPPNSLREPDDGPVVLNEGPLAASELPGCRTRFVRNSSSRGGRNPGVIVWHQTVSRENGSSSQNALTAMANRASAGVSWHALIGRTNGLCTYTVPLNLKAWTQGNANPVAVGIEVEAFGNEGTYVAGKGKAKLVSVSRNIGKRYGIPMRRGRVTFDGNCNPRVVKKGIVEHSDLGRCGGGHVDVTLRDVDAVIRTAASAAKPCNKTCQRRKRDRATHRELKRRHCGPPGKARSSRCKLLNRRHAALHRALGKPTPR